MAIGGAVSLLLAVGFFALGEWILQKDFNAVREREQAKAERLLYEEGVLQNKAELRKAVTTSAGVIMAAKIGTSARHLWPVWGVMLAGLALIFARHRLQAQVEFVAGDIRTIIPAAAAVPLAKSALVARETADNKQIMMLEQDVTSRRLRDNVGAIRALKSLVPNETPDTLVDVTPDPLPEVTQTNFTMPTFQDILTNLEPGDDIILGYRMDTGEPITGTFDRLYSAVLAGASGSGKTSWGRGIIYQSLQVFPNIRYCVLDPHDAHEDGLAATLPKTDHFTYLDSKDPVPGFTTFGRHLDARLAGSEAHGEPLVFICDELKAASKKSYKDAMVNLFDRITEEGRKVNVFLLALTQDTRQKYGLVFRDSLESAYAFKMTAGRVKHLLQDKELEDIHKSIRTPGIALFVSSDGESCLVKVPECSPKHAKYIDVEFHAETTAAANVTVDTLSDIETAEGHELTPKTIKALRESAGYSQNKLAKKAGVSQSKLSRYESGKAELSESELESLRGVLCENTRKPISLNKYREARQIG